MTAKANAASDTSDRELVFTRLLAAPRALVYQAWTDPRHIAAWWGPNGFTTTTHSMDVRVGGRWTYVMHGPDGKDWPNWIGYLKVVPGELLEYDHAGEEDAPAEFHVAVTFADEGAKTRLTMKMVFPTAAARDHVVQEFGATEGANQTLSRLEQHLTTM